MFINDVNKGFHVYDYADAKKPIRSILLKLRRYWQPSKGNTVYINQTVDLVLPLSILPQKIFYGH
jgi:hypothetical protein